MKVKVMFLLLYQDKRNRKTLFQDERNKLILRAKPCKSNREIMLKTLITIYNRINIHSRTYRSKQNYIVFMNGLIRNLTFHNQIV